MGWRAEGDKAMRVLMIVLVVAIAGTAWASEPVDGLVSSNVLESGREAVRLGMAWLEGRQATNGCIGEPKYPAITAMACRALKDGGSTNMAALVRAEAYLRQYMAGPPPGWMNDYNLSICRTMLGEKSAKKASSRDVWIEKRMALDREYSARARDFGLRQAAWQQQRAAALAKGEDADWTRAARIAQCVKGGATMVPVLPLDVTDSAPAKTSSRKRRGYGNLSYDGRLKLIHDDVQSDDPRVDAYLDWAERSWSLDANPGAGTRGLYYFYQSLSKCLAAGGEEKIQPLNGGAPIRWREEMIRKLVALQRLDESSQTSYWVNDDGAWMEDNPVLVTTYALLALERALPKVEDVPKIVSLK